MDVIYNANDVTVEVINVFPGDFDVDGDVDGLDFLLWQLDPNIGSLADWRANFGMVAPISAATAIPEPTTIALSLAVFGLTMARRRLA